MNLTKCTLLPWAETKQDQRSTVLSQAAGMPDNAHGQRQLPPSQRDTHVPCDCWSSYPLMTFTAHTRCSLTTKNCFQLRLMGLSLTGILRSVIFRVSFVSPPSRPTCYFGGAGRAGRITSLKVNGHVARGLGPWLATSIFLRSWESPWSAEASHQASLCQFPIARPRASLCQFPIARPRAWHEAGSTQGQGPTGNPGQSYQYTGLPHSMDLGWAGVTSSTHRAGGSLRLRGHIQGRCGASYPHHSHEKAIPVSRQPHLL